MASSWVQWRGWPGEGSVSRSILGLSMTALQFAIGVLNDIVDAPADAGRVPPKAIPGGYIAEPVARVALVGAALVGLTLAATIDGRLFLVALVVLAIGAAYDVAAKGTRWSWVPFAVGIPILPVYGWFGATGSLPASFATLIPMAVLAGAGWPSRTLGPIWMRIERAARSRWRRGSARSEHGGRMSS